MAAVNPNMNCGILIDEFIRMANQHLLTVKGTIITTATYLPAGTPAPSQVIWSGYKVMPTDPEIIELGQMGEKIINSNYKAGKTKSTIVGFIEDEDLGDVQIQNIVYPNLVRADGTTITNYGNTLQTNFVAKIDEARAVAEAYMGQPFVDDQEWSNFISLVAAESTVNQTEQAWVAAVILNRTRLRVLRATTVTQTINRPNQFEPVTGPASSRVWYLRGPTPAREKSIFGSLKEILPGVDKDYINFTSNNDCAYVRCSGGVPTVDGNGNFIPIPKRRYSYLLDLRAKPSNKVIGGTIFSK